MGKLLDGPPRLRLALLPHLRPRETVELGLLRAVANATSKVPGDHGLLRKAFFEHSVGKLEHHESSFSSKTLLGSTAPLTAPSATLLSVFLPGLEATLGCPTAGAGVTLDLTGGDDGRGEGVGGGGGEEGEIDPNDREEKKSGLGTLRPLTILSVRGARLEGERLRRSGRGPLVDSGGKKCTEEVGCSCIGVNCSVRWPRLPPVKVHPPQSSQRVLVYPGSVFSLLSHQSRASSNAVPSRRTWRSRAAEQLLLRSQNPCEGRALLWKIENQGLAEQEVAEGSLRGGGSGGHLPVETADYDTIKSIETSQQPPTETFQFLSRTNPQPGNLDVHRQIDVISSDSSP
eukprot:767077-Hanusia_phi.AAC.1